MKIFIDVDNTILEHSGFYSITTEARIHSTIGEYPIENNQAIEIMYESSICRNPDIVKALFENDDVYILTKYAAIEYEQYKQKRVAKILGLTVEELVNKQDSKGINKYIYLPNEASKVDTVFELFDINSLEGCILLDDYSANLIEWQNYGGTAIKYYNQYNSANHPTKGISISNFNFFKSFITKDPYKNLMIVCQDSIKMEFFTEYLNKRCDYSMHKIDVLKLVIEDFKDKFKLEQYTIGHKYDLKNFIVEYYHFMNTIDENYWHNYFVKAIGNHIEDALICATFDMDLRKIKIADNSLGLKLIDKNNVPSDYIFDIYLTIDANNNVGDILNAMFEHIVTIVSFVFRKGMN